MTSMLEWCRLPWRVFGCRLTCDMLMPIIVQPVYVFLLSLYTFDSILIVSLVSFLILLTIIFCAKFESRSQILYYWIASSITYVVLIFENIVVPLSEIDSQENFVLILFAALSLWFLYLTKAVSERSNLRGDFSNCALNETCPVCRVKISPRSYHCHICQICIEKYDFHCYWLDCCIGDGNHHFFVLGLLFSILALGYASLLILTTICQPEFVIGVLLPKDCADVSATIGTFTCFVCGIYCMELALLLLFQLILQFWLISTGYSALDWKGQFKYNIFRANPHSRGFWRNWLHFCKNFKKITM